MPCSLTRHQHRTFDGCIPRIYTKFPHVALETLRPGPNDTATLLKEGRADLGLMTEQESYPMGFQFRGVGHSKLVPVCASTYPLAKSAQVGFHDPRQYRQLIPRSRSLTSVGHLGERKGMSVLYAESPDLIVEFVLQGLGWAELPFSVVSNDVRGKHLPQLVCRGE